MENQRIQKLVKLAYIADIHGDYKIADKIFTKIAQLKLPPKFKEEAVVINPEATRPDVYKTSRLVDWLEGMRVKLEPSIKKQQDLEALIKKFETIKDKNTSTSGIATVGIPATGSAAAVPATVKQISQLTDQDMAQALEAYKSKMTRLKASRQNLNALRGGTIDDNVQADIVKEEEEIRQLEQFIDDYNYVELFGPDPDKPINKIPLSSLLKSLERIKLDIDKDLPDPGKTAELLSLYKDDENAMRRLRLFFDKINTRRADSTLDKLKLETKISDDKINMFRAFFMRRGHEYDTFKNFLGSNVTYLKRLAAERTSIPFSNVSRKKYPKEAIRAWFKLYYKNESQEFKEKFKLYMQALDKELVYTYIQEREKYIKERNVAGKLSPNDESTILGIVRVKVAEAPTGAIISGLFESMTKNFKVLKEAATVKLKQKNKALTEPNILAEMKLLDSNFMKNTGIDPTFAYRLIADENLSIEEFLNYKINPYIANIKDERITAALWFFGTAGIAITWYMNSRAQEQKANEQLRGTVTPEQFRRDSEELFGGRPR